MGVPTVANRDVLTRISLILPTTKERAGLLIRAFASVEHQRGPGDEIVIQLDDPPHGDKGAWARNIAMRRASGTHLMFLDDDDVFLPNAFADARKAIAETPTQPILFRVRYPRDNGLLNWRRSDGLVWGEISTLGIVVPNTPLLPQWDGVNWTNHESKFMIEACNVLPKPVVFRPEVIAEALGH